MRSVGIAVLVSTLGIAVLSLLLWLAGLVTGYTLGGFVHLLLVLALLVGPAGLLAGVVLIVVGGKQARPR